VLRDTLRGEEEETFSTDMRRIFKRLEEDKEEGLRSTSERVFSNTREEQQEVTSNLSRCEEGERRSN
jgi:23S rRNA U2552 (ribose-2'-O)-methylase RlmE/FtsJ